MINWLILHHVSSDICLILKDLCINITYSPIQPLNIIYNFNNFSVYNGIFILHTVQHYFLCLCILLYYIVIIIVIIVIVIVEHIIPWFWYLPTVPLSWMTPWWNARPLTWAGCWWCLLSLVPASASFCPATIRLQLQWNASRVELETKVAEDYAKFSITEKTRASPGWKRLLMLSPFTFKTLNSDIILTLLTN